MPDYTEDEQALILARRRRCHRCRRCFYRMGDRWDTCDYDAENPLELSTDYLHSGQCPAGYWSEVSAEDGQPRDRMPNPYREVVVDQLARMSQEDAQAYLDRCMAEKNMPPRIAETLEEDSDERRTQRTLQEAEGEATRG